MISRTTPRFYSQPELQLALRVAGLARRDEALHGRLERAVTRKADAFEAPKPVGIKPGDGLQRVVAARVRVARQVAKRGQVSKQAALLRATCIIQAPSGSMRMPAMWTARDRSSITKKTMNRTVPKVARVSTAKKSHAYSVSQ